MAGVPHTDEIIGRYALYQLATALLVLWSAPAFGAPAAQERALAESLFRAANDLVQQGKIAEACPKFAESQRLDPQLGTLLHLATCHEQDGKTASAWVEFTEAAMLAARSGQPKRETIARERAAALEKRLSRFVLELEDPEEQLTVTLDGKPIGKASLATPLPVDPGEHVIEASAPGKQSWTKRLEAPEGPSEQTVRVPALTASGVDSAPSDDDDDVGPREGGDSSQMIVGFVVGGVGVVGVVIGAAFGLVAAQQSSDADELCEGRLCTQEGLDMHDDASASALGSTIAFGVGLAAVAAGLVIVLTAPSDDGGDGAAWIQPTVGGAAIGGRF